MAPPDLRARVTTSAGQSDWNRRLSLFALGVGVTALVWRWFTYYEIDDVFYFFKVGRLATGAGLVPGVDRDFLDSIPPFNYSPHPGANWPILDFPCEYPPLAFVFMWVPALLTNEYTTYQMIFGAEMVAVQLLLGWVALRLHQRVAPDEVQARYRIALLWGLFTLCNTVPIVRRFDVMTSALASLGFLAAMSRRPLTSGLLIGLGAAVKLWPALLIPVVLLPDLFERDWRRGSKLVVAASAGFLVPHLPFLLLAGPKAFEYLGYHGARGIQIESTWANTLLIVSKLASWKVESVFKFGAWQVESGAARQLVPASYLAALAGYCGALLAGFIGWRRGLGNPASLAQRWISAAAAIVVVTMLMAKVLSAQYFLWLFPLAFVIPGARGLRIAGLATLASALTYLIYPVCYLNWIIPATWPGLLLVLTRNLTLGAVAVLLVRSAAGMGEGETQPAQDPTQELAGLSNS